MIRRSGRDVRDAVPEAPPGEEDDRVARQDAGEPDRHHGEEAPVADHARRTVTSLEGGGQPGEHAAGREHDVLGHGEAEAAQERGRRRRRRSRRGGRALRACRPAVRACARSITSKPPLRSRRLRRARGPSVGTARAAATFPRRRAAAQGPRSGQLPQEVAALGAPGGQVGGDGERQLEAGLRLLGLEPLVVALGDLHHLAGRRGDRRDEAHALAEQRQRAQVLARRRPPRAPARRRAVFAA